jgi:hypothetical protein
MFTSEDGFHIPFEIGIKKESDYEVIPETRTSKKAIKKKRAKKGTYASRPLNLKDLNEMKKAVQQLPKRETDKKIDRPFYYYFDIIAEKSDTITGQTSKYVELALKMLIDSGLFSSNGISTLNIWSDGCGKVYPYNSHRHIFANVDTSTSRPTVTSTF